MTLKTTVNDLLDEFKLGKLDIDMAYKLGSNGKVEMLRFSIHPPYKWDGKKEPAYISFDLQEKAINLSSISYSDLKDETINKFFQLPEDFGEF